MINDTALCCDSFGHQIRKVPATRARQLKDVGMPDGSDREKVCSFNGNF